MNCDVIDVNELVTTADYLATVNNAEQLAQLEELTQVWCKQIEQVRLLQHSFVLILTQQFCKNSTKTVNLLLTSCLLYTLLL